MLTFPSKTQRINEHTDLEIRKGEKQALFLKWNKYRPASNINSARDTLYTDILKDSFPSTRGTYKARRCTSVGQDRTQSGLHFSCRGCLSSYWKYLHIIYGAHMLQEPNAAIPTHEFFHPSLFPLALESFPLPQSTTSLTFLLIPHYFTPF